MKLRDLTYAAGLVVFAAPAMAGTFSGTISDADGNAVHGAMVRVSDSTSGISQTVFSNPQGEFALATELQGRLSVRLRAPYHRDLKIKIELAGDGSVAESLVMEAMTGEAEISASLPSAYHFGGLEFETGEGDLFSRRQFQRDCLSCHQLGNAYTRRARPVSYWETTIQRMHRYMGGKYNARQRRQRAEILSQGFDGTPVSVRPSFPLDPSLSDTVITEYRLDRGNPHDSIVHPETGIIYSADMVMSHFTVTDPKTGKSEYVSQLGNGNQYHAADGEIGSFSAGTRNMPHSMALGHDGKYYVTNTATNSIGVFNPMTNAWEPSHKIAGARYPHTIRIDAKGIAWFTNSASDNVGRLDPVTGESTIIPLPSARPLGGSRGTWTYGIDINPSDGSVWYGRLFADKIGRIDPNTLEVQQFDAPMHGPRRMHFDKAGVLWVAGFAEGELARITPTEDGFDATVYRLPEFAPGYRPGPYALGVHPETQEIWLNGTVTDYMYRFIPSEERFVAYPTPLRGTYTRDISFTADGQACAANNPFPLTSLEGGTSEILCLKVN